MILNSPDMPCPSIVIDNMIEQQIRPWGVLDQTTLDLFHSIRREDFVPAHYCSLAYSDINIPLYQEQFMLEPKVQAHIIQALQLTKEHRVLLIGAGMGFLTALLAQLSREVIAYEIDKNCFQQAEKNLQQYDIQNIKLFNEDGLGFKKSGFFDKIVICATVDTLPEIFIENLQVLGQLIYFKKPIKNDVLSNMCLLHKSSHDSIKEELLLQALSPTLQNHNAREPFIF